MVATYLGAAVVLQEPRLCVVLWGQFRSWCEEFCFVLSRHESSVTEFSAPKNIQMRENELLLLREHSDYLTSQLGKVLAGTADYQL